MGCECLFKSFRIYGTSFLEEVMGECVIKIITINMQE